MPVRSSFTAGEVLTAADLTDTFASKVDYALPANAQSGTGASAYTFVLADASRLTTATGTSAKTFTIPPQASVAWVANSIIRVANYGTGDLTIAGGSGVTVTNASKTLAQFESAALVRTGSNAWTLIPFSGGAGNADFSNAATGTYSDSGFNYKYVTFTASGTLTVTKAGFADVLIIGGGGGGGFGAGGGGGAGGHLYLADVYLPTGGLTVRVGAGGAATPLQSHTTGKIGGPSVLNDAYSAIGGGGGGSRSGTTAGDGGSGGGGAAFATSNAGSTFAPYGSNGGAGVAASGGAGGGGGAGAVGSAGSGNNGGAGGAGAPNSITGSAITRAGGGGGGSQSGSAGSGGAGGGGAGSANDTTATSGTANTGGGGGGGGLSSTGSAGGNGGSGIVIVRVRV